MSTGMDGFRTDILLFNTEGSQTAVEAIATANATTEKYRNRQRYRMSMNPCPFHIATNKMDKTSQHTGCNQIDIEVYMENDRWVKKK